MCDTFWSGQGSASIAKFTEKNEKYLINPEWDRLLVASIKWEAEMGFEIQKSNSQVTLLCSCAAEAHRDKDLEKREQGRKAQTVWTYVSWQKDTLSH